jgi:hypothetical protein
MCQIRQLLPSLAISCQTDYIFLMNLHLKAYFALYKYQSVWL